MARKKKMSKTMLVQYKTPRTLTTHLAGNAICPYHAATLPGLCGKKKTSKEDLYIRNIFMDMEKKIRAFGNELLWEKEKGSLTVFPHLLHLTAKHMLS